MIARREIDAPRPEALAVFRPTDFQLAGFSQDIVEETRRARGRVLDDADRRGEGGGKPCHDLAQGIETTGRRANHDNSPVIHISVDHID